MARTFDELGHSADSDLVIDEAVPPPSTPLHEPVFVAVDFEKECKRWRQVHDLPTGPGTNRVSEMGVSRLDTREISSIPPGTRASNWFRKIYSLHYRITEVPHDATPEGKAHNDYHSPWCQGHPGAFAFAKSRSISLDGMKRWFSDWLASCKDLHKKDGEEKRYIIFQPSQCSINVEIQKRYLRKHLPKIHRIIS